MISINVIYSLFFVVLFIISPFCLAINSQSYFKDQFIEAKNDFLQRSLSLKEKNKDIISDKEFFNYSDSEKVSIDYLLIPSEVKKNLIIVQSGIHGVEAHAGSGIQNYLIDWLHVKKNKLKQTSILFIHGINPFGFKNNRRVNFNNVDLNRNFVLDETDYTIKNEKYALINAFLNPQDSLNLNFFSRFIFYIDSLVLIAKHSKDTLKRAILVGQYQFSKGIYYGGSQHQPEFKALNNIWDRFAPDYENLIQIDLHTGYGEKGKLHLFANSTESTQSENLKKIFAPSTIDFGDDSNFYQVKGDNNTYFQNKYKSKKMAPALTFEIGTLDSQNTLGSLDSIYRIIIENQGYNFQYSSDKTKKSTETLFKEMFYPSDFAWRDQALAQSQKEIEKVINYFEAN